MYRLLPLFFLFLFISVSATAQHDSLIYRPGADAKQELTDALLRAKAEKKQLMVMVGGNWCRWCRMFEKFRLSNARVDSAVSRDYIWLHVNYSKENKNTALLQQLDFPQRFGFPVFVVLDEEGRRLHTQNSAYLEKGEGYDEALVLGFLHQWRREALAPEQYLK